jgi:hypothetical protein
MSQIGTGIAAGVAQTTYQAGEVNQRKTKEVRDKDRKTQRLSDQFEQHMLALDEGDADGDQAPSQLRVHEQLPQQTTIQTELGRYPNPQQVQQYHHHSIEPQGPQPMAEPSEEATTPDQPPHHRHLDIQA